MPAYYLILLTFETVIVLNSPFSICFIMLCVKMDMLVLLQLIAANKSNLHIYLNISVYCCVRRVFSCVGIVYRPINMNYCNLINCVDRRSIY